ncbi:MAG: pyridoxamine 5'-phosphate oxidase family protein [Candidatus Cloacimonetes bacterium]|nr:pyridoxamine 5'-phosphate oxidase family protein [Candidatus Cloacimonadota bacterium]
MGKQYAKLTDLDIQFIKQQHLFFISSSSDKEVNLSPRGYDCLHIESNQKVFFYDYYGSGNRTKADIKADGEITMMFCSFSEKPKILRLFAVGEVISRVSEEFVPHMSNFKDVDVSLVRQVIVLHIYAVETSCGYAVPLMEFKGHRSLLRQGLEKIGSNDEIQNKFNKYPKRASLQNLS